MPRHVFSFIVGGKAGQGVKTAGIVASRVFVEMGRDTFQNDDYPSLIRGGHNFSVVSTAPGAISSHYMRAQIVVALGKRSYELHRDHLAPGGLMVYNSDELGEAEGVGLPISSEAKKYPLPDLRMGLAAAAVLCTALGLEREHLGGLVDWPYRRDVENNLAYALAIYEAARPELLGRFSLARGEGGGRLLGGSEAVALGAMAGGLDLYFAYPMTPTTSLLHFLASRSHKLGVTVVHPEN